MRLGLAIGVKVKVNVQGFVVCFKIRVRFRVSH